MSDLLSRFAALSGPERARAMRELRAAPAESAPAEPVPAEPVPAEPVPGEAVPATEAQQRLWLLQQLAPATPAYHLAAALRLDGPLDTAALRRALTQITARHEPLRTSFAAGSDGVPVQHVAPPAPVDLGETDLGAWPPEQREARAAEVIAEEGERPFDLERAPLVRHLLLTLGAERHLLAVVVHHLVCDGVSFGVFFEELKSLYAAFAAQRPSPLPPLPRPYRALPHDPAGTAGPAKHVRALEYWRSQLAGDLPVLELPTDRPRPAEQTFRGARWGFTLPPALTRALHDAAARDHSTPYSRLLAAFAVTLHRAGGLPEMIIGAPVSARPDTAAEKLIGLFVNTLPLRVDLRKTSTVGAACQHVEENLRAALSHPAPYGAIVAQAQAARVPGRALLRQTAFSFQPVTTGTSEAGGLRLRPAGPAEFQLRTSPLDVSLHMRQDEDRLEGCLEYSTDLFDEATVASWAELFTDTVRELCRPPHTPLPEPAAEQPPLPAGHAPASSVPERWTDPPAVPQSNLTQSQLLLHFGAEFTPGVRLYYEYVTALYTVTASLEADRFARAFARLVQHSDALRSTFHHQGGVPVRRVAPTAEFRMEQVDLRGEADPAEGARRWARRRSEAGLDVARRVFDTALLHLDEATFAWYLNIHHALSDAWSMSLILSTVSRYYELDGEGRLDQAQPPPPFADYVAHERRLRESPRYRETEQRLRTELARHAERTDFYRAPRAQRTTRTARTTVDLGAERSARITEFTRREGLLSPASVFAAALFAYLYRIGGGGLWRVGTPFANRSAAFRNTLGLFMNVRPLQARLSGGQTLRDLARETQRAFLHASRSQEHPLRNPQDAPLYDVYFNYQNASFSGFGTDVAFDLLDTGHSVDRLTLQVRDAGGGGQDRFTADLDFNTGCFGPRQREAATGHWLSLLDELLEDPGKALSAARMLADAELRRLEAFNATARPYDLAVPLHTHIARQARLTPAAPAVHFEGTTLTYAELDAASDILARRIRRTGAGGPRGGTVGVHMHRCAELPVALLAVLKSGCAYLPLDPDHPAERTAFMLADAGADLVLATAALPADAAPAGLPVLSVGPADGADGGSAEPPEQDAGPGTAPDGEQDPGGRPAYLIYTSGSTGTPKCVEVSHRGIANRLLWMQEEYGLTGRDRVLQKTPYTFDVSVWEFFWPLMTGACLVLARPEGHKDPGHLVELIQRTSVTTVHFVPSMLRVFLAAPGAYRCTSLRRVVASGEALPPELVEHFHQTLPSAELHNLYGPTEASVDVSAHRCRPADSAGTVPIGRPVANTTLEVLDTDLNPRPVGIPGELHIGGVQLASGYRGRPALTAERFVPDPRRRGERLYRTGDLVRQREDGELEFLGRGDGQVKLRGYRIELGEIESALARHPGVRAAAVRLWEDRLVAYTVPAAGTAPGGGELTPFLARTLPAYMLPAEYLTVPELPVTGNGKLDRAALPRPDRAAPAGDAAGAPPRTPTEATLARMWAELLGTGAAPVGIHDDFFDRGGHSLLAARLLAQVERHFGLRLPLAALFQAPTVAQFAALVAEEKPAPVSSLLPLRTAAPPAPLFLFHPAGGDVLAYRHLARLLPHGREVIGVRSRALRGEREHASIPAMAHRYAQEIGERQPGGPYLLAGWSMGGAVAVEVAAALEARGEQVALVALLDTSVPGAGEEDPLLAPAVALAGTMPEPSVAWQEASSLRTRMRGRPLAERLELLRSWAASRGLLDPDAGEADAALVQQAELAALHERLLLGHRPPVIGAPLSVWWAREALHRRRTGWAEHTRGGVREEGTLPGNHFTLLRPPHVAEAAARLSAAVESAADASPPPKTSPVFTEGELS